MNDFIKITSVNIMAADGTLMQSSPIALTDNYVEMSDLTDKTLNDIAGAGIASSSEISKIDEENDADNKLINYANLQKYNTQLKQWIEKNWSTPEQVLNTLKLIPLVENNALTFVINNNEPGTYALNLKLNIDPDTNNRLELRNNGLYVDKVPGTPGADGEPGANGITPQIRINESNIWEVSYDNGESWLSLEVVAKGEKGKDGLTPTVEIIDGYWYINGENTGVFAGGETAIADVDEKSIINVDSKLSLNNFIGASGNTLAMKDTNGMLTWQSIGVIADNIASALASAKW